MSRTSYFLHPDLGLYQPDRRVGNVAVDDDDRRPDHETVRTSSEQYAFLRNWLERREELQREVGTSGRRTRHALAIVSLSYIGIYFSQPDFSLSFSWLGVEQAFGLNQLAAVAPLIIAYLVLHMSHLGVTRLKLIHECRVIEQDLQRFGMRTGYGLLGAWYNFCESTQHETKHFVSRISQRTIYGLYDLFLFATVVLAFGISAVMAVESYATIRANQPHTYIAFVVFAGLGAAAAVLSILALRYFRREMEGFLDGYLARTDALTDRDVNGPVARKTSSAEQEPPDQPRPN